MDNSYGIDAAHAQLLQKQTSILGSIAQSQSKPPEPSPLLDALLSRLHGLLDGIDSANARAGTTADRLFGSLPEACANVGGGPIGSPINLGKIDSIKQLLDQISERVSTLHQIIGRLEAL